jgi:hypothetical protein
MARLATMPKLTVLGLCRSGGFGLRLARMFGIVGNTDVGSFSQRAFQKLVESHPDCDVSQPVDWDAVNRAS